MVEFKQGNLLEENMEALVNTVNCVGVMGKGIALQFKQAFPENFKQYKKACDAKQVEPGQMFTTSTGKLFPPKYIINFPTKRHWKEKSKIEYIESGLKVLVKEVKQLNIRSIAIPPLGCGNGGLNWEVVKPMIVHACAEFPDVRVVIFEPVGAPVADQIKVATKKPNMTLPCASFIRLLEFYTIPDDPLTRLEIQKLAYFLQESQQPLNLHYEKHHYGPYANDLNHFLERLDGHFIRGYGDRSQHSQMSVLPLGKKAAHSYLEKYPEANERLQRVSNLIRGFKTPDGMEMLATIHWVVTREDPQAAEDSEKAIALVQEWNERKRKLFKPSHLKKGWERLKQQNWFVNLSATNQ